MTQPETGLTRRAFGKQAAAGIAAGWCLAQGARAAADTAADYTFVDIHTHLGQAWGPRAPLSAEELVAWMDEHGIGRAVVLPLVSPEAWDYPISTDYVLNQTARHRDRLVPFCSIDPRTVMLSRYEQQVEMLTRYRDAGARGFGEHKCGVAIDDPRNVSLFRACGEVGLPVLFHLDNKRNFDAPGLPGLATVLETCPDTRFIGHAQGFWASICGDVTQEQLDRYPSTPVAPGGALDALMDRFDNLWGDLSAGSGANAIARDIEFGKAFLERRATRLLFGTDYLATGQAVPQFSLYREIELSDAAKERIFRKNAEELLGLV